MYSPETCCISSNAPAQQYFICSFILYLRFGIRALSTLCYLIPMCHSVRERVSDLCCCTFTIPCALSCSLNCKKIYNEERNAPHGGTRTASPQVRCEAVTQLKQLCSDQCRQTLKIMAFPTRQGLVGAFHVAFTSGFQLFLTTWNFFGKTCVHVAKPSSRKAPSSPCVPASWCLHSVSSSRTNGSITTAEQRVGHIPVAERG